MNDLLWDRDSIKKISLLANIDESIVKKVLKSTIDMTRLDGNGVYPFFKIEDGKITPRKEYYENTMKFNLEKVSKTVSIKIKKKILESGLEL